MTGNQKHCKTFFFAVSVIRTTKHGYRKPSNIKHLEHFTRSKRHEKTTSEKVYLNHREYERKPVVINLIKSFSS